jgi:hypothetical protein
MTVVISGEIWQLTWSAHVCSARVRREIECCRHRFNLHNTERCNVKQLTASALPVRLRSNFCEVEQF